MRGLHQTEPEIRQELKVIETAKKDSRAFGLLYEKYYKPIYLFVYKRVDGRDATEDLTSQVFLKAMVNLPKYQFKGVPFSAWLFRIASNEINLYFRTSNKQRAVNLEEGGIDRLADEITTDEEIDKVALVVKCINTLSEKDLELIELRFFEKNSFKEVAYILGIKETNAKVRVHRIIEKLKKVGKGMFGDE